MRKKKTLIKPKAGIAVYDTLVKRVNETLFKGQAKIERAKVEAYWKTGRYIHQHLLHYADRAGYGDQVIRKLAKEVNVGTRLLHRTLQFYRSFPSIVSRGTQLKWSQYRILTALPDEKLRLEYAKRAAMSRWTTDDLIRKIQAEIKDEPIEKEAVREESRSRAKTGTAILKPKRGVLHTYRLMESESPAGKKEAGELWIDLGFNIRRRLSGTVEKFTAGDIAESSPGQPGFALTHSNRSEKDLYTYKASVERVVDGDTLIAEVDLGFETHHRLYIRLRGIDAPEMDTAPGKEASEFLKRELEPVAFVILTTTRADKYGRYLADVFYSKAGQEIFLNQKLLDEGRAVFV